MARLPLASVVLLLLLSPALAAPEADHVFSSILPSFGYHQRLLERSEVKSDRKKAKVLAKLIARGEDPRPTLRDELAYAVRVEKKLRKKLPDQTSMHGSFGWAVAELDRLVGEGCRRALLWVDSFPFTNDLARAHKKGLKAAVRYALATEAATVEDRVRHLEKACKYLAKAEKRLAKLGPRPDPVAFLSNPGFERGTGDVPTEWVAGAPADRAAWEAMGTGYTGERCVSIGSTTPELQYSWYTTIRDLIPGRYYNVSAMIRGENVVVHTAEPAEAWGGYIEVLYHPFARSDRGAVYQGTFGWREISFTFRAEDEVTGLALGLGRPGTKVSGKVWFDDVTISGTDWAAGPPEGDRVRLFLEAEDVENSGIGDVGLATWIDRLDSVCDAYEELVGGVPYDGAKIDILSVRQYPGGWAVAGNPIRWQRRYIEPRLRAFVEEGDWSFGILHELGHDYDLDYRWVYQAEVQANFKMVYVLEKLHATVKQGGVLYTGAAIKDNYEKAYLAAKADGAVTSWAGWLYRLICVKDEIGWEPFRQLYRSYPEGNRTRLEKLLLYFDELERHSGRDIRGELIPAEEWAWVLENL